MTREIEFRAWDHDNNKMIFWTLNDLLIRFGDPEYQFNVEDRPSFLFDWRQYTGLKDKNGKKIFDGDIVKSKNGDLFIINEFSGSFGASSIKNDLIWHGCSTVSFAKQEFVIVGNIDENPELLY